MNQDSDPKSGQPPLAALQRFARRRTPAEQCELCSAQIAPDPHHQHLLDPQSRQLLCACDPCATLFSGQAKTKYRRVPRDVAALMDFQMSDAQWNELLVPVGMAFFFYNSAEERVMALYPSPAGATESLLTLESWQEIKRDNPVLDKMEPDVEGLLVNRTRRGESSSAAYYLVPIDQFYRLVGLIRSNWRGLSGGSEVWREIGEFFERLEKHSTHKPAPAPLMPTAQQERQE